MNGHGPMMGTTWPSEATQISPGSTPSDLKGTKPRSEAWPRHASPCGLGKGVAHSPSSG